MKCALYVAVLAVLVGSSLQAALKLPSYIKPCSRSDPNINACVLKSAAAALPKLLKGDQKYHVPVLDPFHLTHIEVVQGSGPVKISLSLDDVYVKGVKNAEIKSINVDLKKREINVELKFNGQAVAVDSKYKIDGQVLVLPITGSGDMNLKIENLTGTFTSKFDLIKKEDGKEYVKIHDSNVDVTLTKAIFDFKNLFNGDKVLGDNMNLFLNENWQEVFPEVKPVLTAAVKSVIDDILDKVVATVPYEDLFTA